MFRNTFIEEKMLYINKKVDWINPHRYYLLVSITIDEFTNDLDGCFPNLFFHERIYKTIKAFNNITNHIHELYRHLCFLNDHAKIIYDEYGADETYKRFETDFDIISSGRGSNEGLDLFKCIFVNENKKDEEVRCNPHTKLYQKNSDYRIYFNWGRASIQGGKILIGHIGGHWKKK